MRYTALERESIFGCRVSHAFYQHERQPDALTVLFPGRGYTAGMPLLYYAGMAAYEKGLDALGLEYGFFKAGKPFAAEDVGPFVEELVSTLRAAGALHYRTLYFVSKSLGTVLAGAVKSALGHPDVRQLFLTPVEPTLPYMLGTKATAVMGTADDSFPQHCIGAVRADAGCELIFIDDADHALETPQGILHNLSIMERMAGVYGAFFR
ncbi:MAG TPA: hypothetical protein VN366_13185 [Feifaniaceae bacterium]|nr:hypothetical protein [Feifaniaceae bacterium]